MRATRLFLLVLAAAALATAVETAPAAIRTGLAELTERLPAATFVIKGQDDWYFLRSELRSYSCGRFWGADAAKTARSAKDQDPLAAILAFHRMVSAAGITLIVVPVPGKVAIYPDKVDAAFACADRWDEAHQAFLATLAESQVLAIDLVPDFLSLRRGGVDPFAKQDSHWSPAGMRVAAERIAALVMAQDWYGGIAKRKFPGHSASVEARGDLVQMLNEEDVGPERFEVIRVPGADPDAASPLVLLGDSHTLVYHDPTLLAEQAGLSDQLASLLDMRLDLVGVKGSGANGSRAVLARRKDNLAGKNCLVWVFTAREFTESNDGWKVIPVIR